MPRFLHCFHRWLALGLAGVAATAMGQAAPAPRAVTSSAESVPAWRSAFEGYRPFSDAPVSAWREANDTVGRIGGWRSYAREAAQPGAVPAAPSAGTAPAPAPASAAPAHQH